MNWTSLIDGLNVSVIEAFGREVQYIPAASGVVRTIRAIFEATSQAEDRSPGVFARLFLRVADLTGPPTRGDAVTVDGVTYKVYEIEADSVGGAVLGLHA